MTKNVLVTGASGFIGANFLKVFLDATDWQIHALDSFRHKGTYSRLSELAIEDNFADRVTIYRHDLQAPIDDQLAKRIGKIDYIFNLASDSHVDRSVTDPASCWRNNTENILTMLEYARKFPVEKFFQVSTDEVYGEYIGDGRGHVEFDVILPSNPYAASKAAQEALCISYWRSYDMPICIVNTMNNIGEWQDHEKFIPRVIRLLSTGKKVTVHTDQHGKFGSRVYIDARDHARALLFLSAMNIALYGSGMTGNQAPDKYNVCGETELDNLQVTTRIADAMNVKLDYECVPANSLRPGYDRRYLLDNSKLRNAGWLPKNSFTQTIERIVNYSMSHPWWL